MNGINPRRIVEALPELFRSLQRSGFQVAVDQHLEARDLILVLTAEGRAPSGQELRAALAGLLCENGDQQDKFPSVFDGWYQRLTPETERGDRDTVGEEAPTRLLPEFGLSKTKAIFLSLGAAVLAAVVAGVIWELLKPPAIPPPPISGDSANSRSGVSEQPVSEILPERDLTLEVRPRQPPEPVVVPPESYPVWATVARNLWLIPAFLCLFWLIRRFLLHRIVLERRKQRPDEKVQLDQIRVKDTPGVLFSSPELNETWRHLREFSSRQSARLDEAATVERTLESGGFFRPVFRERQIPPAYVLLVDRRHAEDHAAAMADDLKRTMRRENLRVHAFSYAEDPRYSVPEGRVGRERSPAALASVYHDHTLLMVGDGQGLFDPFDGSPKPWTREFAGFRERVLLTQEPTWWQGERIEHLSDAGFRVFPLTIQGVAQLSAGDAESGFDDPRDLPTPQRFAVSADRWLEERRPPGAVLEAAIADLEQYLGPEGFLLASATAAYPEIYARLTAALDTQLGLSAADRGLRLRRLARLPWYRRGYMPGYLRVVLLRRLRPEDFKRVTDAFSALIAHRDQSALEFPVAVPERRGVGAMFRAYLRGAARSEPLGDHVFASVVQGRRPRRHEFALPRGLLRDLPSSGWQRVAAPALTALVTVPAAVWLNAWLWSAGLALLAEDQARSAMLAENSSTRVAVSAPENLSLLAGALNSTLQRWGFAQAEEVPPESNQSAVEGNRTPTNAQPLVVPSDRVANGVSVRADATTSAEELGLLKPGESASFLGEVTNWFRIDHPDHGIGFVSKSWTRVVTPDAVIEYAPGGRSAAVSVAARVSYLYFDDAKLVLSRNTAIPDGQVQARLLERPRVFRDLFKEEAVPTEPEMVVVPAGRFWMGDLSGAGEPSQGPASKGKIARSLPVQGTGDDDERPVREVTIPRSFAIGKYEVTFAEYEVFAEAADRAIPDDAGWVGGRQPVINVTWEDATAYAEWLSAATGKRYRLPTEAEWEYVARAGTETDYWWGNDVREGGQVRANCNGCGSEWDARQAAPVGSFPANPFGLHDTAGNVWEWTQDCWNNNYEGAPTDGTAWLEGDCALRMVRGGSWYFYPRDMRSSFRSGFNPDFRHDTLGFRLAQDLE